MRIQALLLALPITLTPFSIAQKPAPKPAEKPAEKPAAQETPGAIPTQILSPLDPIAHQLAKGARERELKDLLNALDKLGYPKANHDKLEKLCKDELAKAKIPIDSLPAGAKQLRITAKQLVAIMDKLPADDDKKALAKHILLLDGENAEAHAILEHKKIGKSWVPSELEESRARRGEILRAVTEAKKLDVDMEKQENADDAVIEKGCGVKATILTRGQFEVHTNFSLEKSERIFRECVRACALSQWVRNGKSDAKLELPKSGPVAGRRNFTLIDSREKFQKMAADAVAAGQMDPENAKHLTPTAYESGSFNLVTGEYVVLAQFEAATQATLLVAMLQMKEKLHSPLSAGHLNWLTLTCFGGLLPGYFYKEEQVRKFGGTFVETDEQKREREELQRMAKAGIAGSRSWMQFLAEHGEDPSFANSFVDAMGAISGNDLHKCTSIVEYLQETGQFGALYKKLKPVANASALELYNNALGMTIGELESRWRVWLLGSRPGVAERIDKENLNAWPKEAIAVIDYMNQVRDGAFKDKARTRIEGTWKLKFDPELSEQCALHAHYLTLHDEQRKWPDAHEEYADKEGYSVEGAWAGTHSVIVWGTLADYKEGCDVWLASFYHRIPLIDPGVLRLGWGSEDIFMVMDMSSLATPYEKPYAVFYPYDGQKDVDVKFLGNEHPDPIPNGEPGSVDEEKLYGNPITIQTNPVDERGEIVDIDMKLYEGKDEKNEVECFFSTPTNPTNKESAPAGVWCLIPKHHLKNNTEYHCIAQWKAGGNRSTTSVGRREQWKFKTK